MDEQLHFASFRLDLANERLWRGTDLLPLRPKSHALLRYLVEHPNRLVPQAEFIRALWQHSFLSDGLLRGYIRELRRVLGDNASAPRFIETANGHGYRFIAPVTRVASPDLPVQTVTAVAADTRQDRGAHEQVEPGEIQAPGSSLMPRLEDLYCSDPATLALLGLLARRIEPAGLLAAAPLRCAETCTPLILLALVNGPAVPGTRRSRSWYRLHANSTAHARCVHGVGPRLAPPAR